MDSIDIIVDDDYKMEAAFHPDFLEDYGCAKEEVPKGLPDAHGRELQTNVFFDADFAHDVKTRQSIAGIIVCVGRTPVEWYSE